MPRALFCFTALCACTEIAHGAQLLEEVIVKARKKDENALTAPLSLTVLDSDRMESLKIRDLTRITVDAPTVALDDVGTRRGTANFSIRGLGINSSIPSIEPTVGVFVNGVYLGINNDILFDLFDLESIEVVRGPQGVLFGRNVTGGAILMNTKAPTDSLEYGIKVATEGRAQGGKSLITEGVVSGPLSDTLAGRIAVYRNDDDGYFRNRFDGEDFGALEQTFLRGSLAWEATDNLDLNLAYERGRLDGDGPAVQSHENGAGVPGFPQNFDRDSLDFAIDERGYQEVDYDFVTLTAQLETARGIWTNTFGWRDQSSEAMSDIDGQPVFLFHSPGWVDYSQWSNELRFASESASGTRYLAGAYVFQSDLAYHDRRLFVGDDAPVPQATVTQDGGGLQDVETLAVFGTVEKPLTQALTLDAGLRLSREEKSVQVASFNLNTNASCNIVEDGDCPFDFSDTLTTTTLAPSLGLRWAISDERSAYLSWTRSYRSGGYNLRNSNSAEAPGPVDEETVDGFELGLKHQARSWQLEAALFHTRIGDMQREVSLASESAGILQLLRNTADATISGVEASLRWKVSDTLLFSANAAVLDASYQSVRFDLNGDGTVDNRDKALDLPRAPELTWGASLEYALPSAFSLEPTLRLSYSYRDQVAYTDNNLGFILEQELLDLDFTLRSPDGRWHFSAYGRNLLDSVKHGGDSQLPATFFGQPLGGTFSPLARGKMLGLALSYHWQ